MEDNDKKEVMEKSPKSILEIRENLLKSESVELWKREIVDILNGARDGYLNQNKNIKIYIEAELFPILDPDKPKSRESVDKTHKLFISALEQTVEQWNPALKREKEFFACILELIQAYAPQIAGVERVWEFLEVWEYRLDEIPVFGGYNSKKDLIQESLYSFNKYFPIPIYASHKNYSRFKNYVDILRKYLFVPQYSGYCAVRLFNLNKQDLKDEIFRVIIRQMPSVLEELCDYIFSPNEALNFKSNLNKICRYVFTTNEEAVFHFNKVLALYGARVDYNQLKPTIELEDGALISFSFEESNAKPVSIKKAQSIKEVMEVAESKWTYSSTDTLITIAQKAFAKEAGYYE